jgi:hypothetical protein
MFGRTKSETQLKANDSFSSEDTVSTMMRSASGCWEAEFMDRVHDQIMAASLASSQGSGLGTPDK